MSSPGGAVLLLLEQRASVSILSVVNEILVFLASDRKVDGHLDGLVIKTHVSILDGGSCTIFLLHVSSARVLGFETVGSVLGCHPGAFGFALTLLSVVVHAAVLRLFAHVVTSISNSGETLSRLSLALEVA